MSQGAELVALPKQQRNQSFPRNELVVCVPRLHAFQLLHKIWENVRCQTNLWQQTLCFGLGTGPYYSRAASLFAVSCPAFTVFTFSCRTCSSSVASQRLVVGACVGIQQFAVARNDAHCALQTGQALHERRTGISVAFSVRLQRFRALVQTTSNLGSAGCSEGNVDKPAANAYETRMIRLSRLLHDAKRIAPKRNAGFLSGLGNTTRSAVGPTVHCKGVLREVYTRGLGVPRAESAASRPESCAQAQLQLLPDTPGRVASALGPDHQRKLDGSLVRSELEQNTKEATGRPLKTICSGQQHQ